MGAKKSYLRLRSGRRQMLKLRKLLGVIPTIHLGLPLNWQRCDASRASRRYGAPYI
jgi:hypothetical protein